MIWAILPAAGTGSRSGSALPKQYRPLLGRPMIEYALDVLAAHPDIDGLMLALAPDTRVMSMLFWMMGDASAAARPWPAVGVLVLALVVVMPFARDLNVLARGELTARALGVRQSIFPPERRDALYDLFEKYRAWLGESRLFDLNLVAQDWLARAQPRYDFVVIDEVQDLTPVQLALVLKTLKKPGQFLLCGDSNQIVHPNFFSWAQVKSLFWQDAALAERQNLSVLAANFRNGHEATRVANQLLKIKQRRFGSIDRESNFLVDAIGGEPGEVVLMADKDAALRELDKSVRQSTRFAVLVMRDEDKAEARKRFATPLLFSIHEAKGLEYDNIVLYRFVSDHRKDFAEIVDGVEAADLALENLEYRRARDKEDKSLEVYKFFVNALYVALTRAIRNLYVVESDVGHPLFGLLGLADGGAVKLESTKSTLEDWQKEARKLELQGKQEQARAIRETFLQGRPVPWTPWSRALIETLAQAFHQRREQPAVHRPAVDEDQPGAVPGGLDVHGGDRSARQFGDAAHGFRESAPRGSMP